MIYLHCSDFERFGFDGKCCPHGDCHEDHYPPPTKPGGSEPLVVSTDCCNFDAHLITRDNCAKLVREHRKREFVRRAKRRIEENFQKSAFRLADARLNTYARSAPGELTLDATREEVAAVEQYREAIKAKEENDGPRGLGGRGIPAHRLV